MTDIILMMVPNRPILSSAKLNRLSEISADVALLSLGSLVLRYALDKSDTNLLLLGLIITVACWLISIWLAGK